MIWRAATAFIERRYARDLSLDDIAAAANTSPRQLQRVFAEFGDTTVRDHLCFVRMKEAMRLLEATRLPIGTIARRVGYREPAQFTKAFARQYGTVPSDIRFAARRDPPPADQPADSRRI